MSCARREDSFIPLTWLNPRGTRWGIGDEQQLSRNGNELDGCDSCWQSEADERRTLGNRGRVCNREPNLPRFCRAFLAVSLRIDSRSETLRVEGHCRLHRHHAHRQRHHGKPEHLDRLSVRALLLHRWTRTQGLPGTAPDRTILRLVWLPSWVLSTVVVGEVRRRSPLFTAVAVSLVASFMMVAWDLSLDPIASTIRQNWIWTHGAGYFGVPISNFLGWSFTVYVFLQPFALYVRQSGSDALSRTVPLTHYLQAILVYLWTSVGFLRSFLFHTNMQVTDAVGQTWRTGDIYETSAIMAIYTMIFISILALVILFRDRLMQKNRLP